MPKKRIVVALGRNAFGKTLPEQKTAVKEAAKAIEVAVVISVIPKLIPIIE